MSERLPVQVNPFRLAEQGRELEGEIPLAQARRLAEVLAQSPDVARVKLRFGLDEAGIPLVEGTIEAALALTCQRCLDPVLLQVRSEPRLALVENEAEAKSKQENYDTLLVEDERLVLLDMVEDELLLALPLVPVHARAEDCTADTVRALQPEYDERDAKDEAESPFAVLKNLKPN